MKRTLSDVEKALKRPFPPEKISWRIGSRNSAKTSGIALAYIDARDVMYRLDDVFGMNWQCRYSHAEGKTICEIGALVDGQWIWRAGGAGDTDIEAEKGAISDAFKRAAVLWGVGRYLYELPQEWVDLTNDGRKMARTPALPEWAKPEVWDRLMERREERVEVSEKARQIALTITDAAQFDQWDTAFEAFIEATKDNTIHEAVWLQLKEFSAVRTRLKKMLEEYRKKAA